MRRSCGDPVDILLDILLKRSLPSDLEDPLHWCLYESSSRMVTGSSGLKMLSAPLNR